MQKEQVQTTKTIAPQYVKNKPAALKAWWGVTNVVNNNVVDLSGNDNYLTKIDTRHLELSTEKAVLNTTDSFSIAAWIKLGSQQLNGKLALEEGEYALTAVSQDSATHSAFYLGVRTIEEIKSDGSSTTSLRWNFTASPVDGSETGPIEWLHAHASTPLDDLALNKWVFLVGVCDLEARVIHLYVPESNEAGIAHMPDAWTFWKADGGFQIGRGLWLGRKVDFWPGEVGTVRAFSGVLSADDAKRLYQQDLTDVK